MTRTANGSRRRGEGADLAAIVDSLDVRYRTASDLAYSALRQAIVTGQLAPGEKLGQEELARSLGLSREPVRSAILQLASDGLVEVHPHRGAVVQSLSIDHIREIYELRLLLERRAIELGIGAMTPERLARLERAGSRLDRSPRSPASVRLRTAFYDLLYDGERSPVMVAMIDRLRSDVGRYWMRRREASEQEDGHRPLLEFARQGDVAGAVAWLETHFRQVADELIASLEAAPPTPPPAPTGRRRVGYRIR